MSNISAAGSTSFDRSNTVSEDGSVGQSSRSSSNASVTSSSSGEESFTIGDKTVIHVTPAEYTAAGGTTASTVKDTAAQAAKKYGGLGIRDFFNSLFSGGSKSTAASSKMAQVYDESDIKALLDLADKKVQLLGNLLNQDPKNLALLQLTKQAHIAMDKADVAFKKGDLHTAGMQAKEVANLAKQATQVAKESSEAQSMGIEDNASHVAREQTKPKGVVQKEVARIESNTSSKTKIKPLPGSVAYRGAQF